MKTVCLEDLVDVLPLTSQPAIDAATISRTVDEESNHALLALSNGQKALSELEVMEGYLRKNVGEMGKAGVAFANLAFESVLDSVQLSTTKPTIDQKAFASHPQEAMDAALVNLAEKKSQIVESLKTNAACILELLGNRVKLSAQYAKQTSQEIARLRAVVEAAQPDAPINEGAMVGLWQGSEYLMYCEGTAYPINYQSGARALKDLSLFLNSHRSAFGEMVKYYSLWAKGHMGAKLVMSHPFADFSFNPNSLFVFGMQLEEADPTKGTATYVSQQLPGMMAYRLHTTNGLRVGEDAISAIGNLRASLEVHDREARYTQMTNLNREDNVGLAQLNKSECDTRLGDINMALNALMDWSVGANMHNWNGVDFNQLYAYIIKMGDGNITSRQLGELSAALVMLLNDASSHVFDYSAKVIDNALVYVARCLGERSQ